MNPEKRILRLSVFQDTCLRNTLQADEINFLYLKNAKFPAPAVEPHSDLHSCFVASAQSSRVFLGTGDLIGHILSTSAGSPYFFSLLTCVILWPTFY